MVARNPHPSLLSLLVCKIKEFIFIRLGHWFESCVLSHVLVVLWRIALQCSGLEAALFGGPRWPEVDVGTTGWAVGHWAMRYLQQWAECAGLQGLRMGCRAYTCL